MESVRQTDEVYEGGHMGSAMGMGGVGGGLPLHIAACLFTSAYLHYCPQDSAFLTLISKPPYCCLALTPLSPNPSHVFSEGAQTKRHPRD